MITGNKGEWSELYVLLQLLAKGKIYAADEFLNRLDDIYFPVLKVLREDKDRNIIDYIVTENGVIELRKNGQFVKSVEQNRFQEEADYLFSQIISGNSGSFCVRETETFMDYIACDRLAAPSTNKTDITVQIHDINTGYSPICGFSIKSELGNPPTLLNASEATNFIYTINEMSDDLAEEINNIDSRNKILDRISAITEVSDICFEKVNNESFSENLMLVDSLMENIVAEMLKIYYVENISSCADLVNRLETQNPLGYPSEGFYTYKVKKLLCAIALGLKPSAKWDGIDEANGGYIITTTSGDVLVYHLYNRNAFEQYLLNNTRLERASTSRHKYAEVYKEDGVSKIKLNLQIRFK